MHAYKHIKLTAQPDLCDIRNEGRRSAIGQLRRGETRHRFVDGIVRFADGTPGRVITKVVHNDHGVIRNPRAKAATRRYLKRVDRAMARRFEDVEMRNRA